MKTHWSGKSTAAVLLAFIFCLLLSHMTAFAVSESADVRIPVSCTDADCTAELLDSGNAQLQTLELKKGEISHFTVPCSGLGNHAFTIKLTNGDTSLITYDKTVFKVNVVLSFGNDGRILSAIEADPTGVIGEAGSGKPTEMTFHNTVKPEDVPTTSITVYKMWVGEGTHPTSVTVNLMRGNGILHSAVLNEDNEWSHTFANLSSAYTYTVSEANIPAGYTASTHWSGNSCTIVNIKDGTTPRPCFDDPPVKKVVLGNPPTDERFTFVMTAADRSFPMPAGSVNGTKELTVTGAGEGEFGVIVFTKVGQYNYSVVERETGADGYTYDKAIYDVIYDVTDQGGQLAVIRTIKKDGTLIAGLTTVTFTNIYTKPKDPSPKTGDDANLQLWGIMAVASLALVALLGVLLLKKRKAKEDELDG